LGAFNPRCSKQQIVGSELGIAIYHFPRLPATKVFQLVARRSRLPMPRSPDVPQIMKPEVRNFRLS
jgi:hypothetical protein